MKYTTLTFDKHTLLWKLLKMLCFALRYSPLKSIKEKTVTRKLMWPVHHIITHLQCFILPTAPKSHPHAFIINILYAYISTGLCLCANPSNPESSRCVSSPQHRSPVSCSAHSDTCPDGKAGDGTAAQEQQWKTLR